MTIFKCFAKDKKDKTWETITREATSKTAFIKSVRKDGYAVKSKTVKESEVFDNIIREAHRTGNNYNWA